MNKEYEYIIDKMITQLKNQKDFAEIVSYLKEKIENEKDAKGEYDFYSGVANAIIEGYENISHDEKEHFLAIHKSLLDMFAYR